MTFTDTWQNANPDAVGGGDDNLEPPADGQYTATLKDAAAFSSKDGRPFCKLVLCDEEQDYTWAVLLGFKSEQQANVTKRQIRELGVDVDEIGDLGDLDAAVKQHVGEFFDVGVKTSGKFRNTFINGAATGVPTGRSDVPTDTSDFAPPPAQAAVSAPVGDDDIPF